MDHTICHFEIPADDLSRAGTFYKDLFGWKIEPWGGPDAIIWMVETVPTDEKGAPIRQGVNGMLIKKQNPRHPFANYVIVESVDEYSAKAVALGGQIDRAAEDACAGNGLVHVRQGCRGEHPGLVGGRPEGGAGVSSSGHSGSAIGAVIPLGNRLVMYMIARRGA